MPDPHEIGTKSMVRVWFWLCIVNYIMNRTEAEAMVRVWLWVGSWQFDFPVPHAQASSGASIGAGGRAKRDFGE